MGNVEGGAQTRHNRKDNRIQGEEIQNSEKGGNK